MQVDLNEIKEKLGIFAVGLVLLGVALFLGWDRLFSVPGIIFCLAIVIILIIGIGNVVSFFVMIRTEKDHSRVVKPVTSTAISVISFIVGIIMYVTDDSLILRGLEAELVWFLISIPAMITAFIQFFVCMHRFKGGE